MSEVYFLGTTKPFVHTEVKLKYHLPRMEEDDMLYNDSIYFEQNLSPDELATGVQKILKGCHIYSIKTTLGLDYETRYEKIYGPKTARTLIEILRWLKDSITSIVQNGGKVYIIKLWQGREISPKEVKRQEIKADEWLITGGNDVIFEYGTLYEFTATPFDTEFCCRDMEYVLKKFADCDSFSFTAIWKEGWRLSEEQAAHALDVYEGISVERCKHVYDNFSDENRREYPSFNALWESFKEKYIPVGREWALMPNGPEKYKNVPKPDGVPEYLCTFWAFALELGMHVAEVELFKAVGTIPPEEELTGEYAAIKPYLIKVLPSFFHHCTSSGVLRCHFVFELNEATKAWLLEYPAADCFSGLLEDLALYKDGYIKLSCCSHEGLCNEVTVPRKGII